MKFVNYCRRPVILILLTLTAWPLVQAQDSLTAKDIDAIRTVEKIYRESWLKNDERAVLSLFAADATLYPNGNPPIKGMDGIRKFWFAPSETLTTINDFQTEIEDIAGDKNVAVVTGSNVINFTSGKKDKSVTKRYVSKGYFISMYVRGGGDWKILKQFWNSKTEEIDTHTK